MPYREIIHPELRILVEELVHQIWVNWMNYMFRCGVYMPSGAWVMPPEMAERWKRQIETRYHDLPEHEKESDKNIAENIFKIINDFTDERVA